MTSLISVAKTQPTCMTTSPLMTGTSIVAVAYQDGIMLCSDTLISYGSLHYKKNHNRFEQITPDLVLVGSGEVSDLQELKRLLVKSEKAQRLHDDQVNYTVSDYAQLLARLCYQRRNKADPYMGEYILAGYNRADQSFQVAKVDLYGNFSLDSRQLTGMAEHMCVPILHNYWNPQVEEGKAKQILSECFRILFSRHARTNDRVQFCRVTSQGVEFDQQVSLGIKWDYARSQNKASEHYTY